MSEWSAVYRRAAAGDVEARNRLFEPLLGPLRAYLRIEAGAHLRAQESLSDLVQSVCRELLQDLQQRALDREGSFRRWVFQAADRKLADRGRRLQARKRGHGARAELASWSQFDAAAVDCYQRFTRPLEAAIGAETQAMVEQALRSLPDEYRQVIALSRIQELPHAETARVMGRSEGATRILLYRALAVLAKKLEANRRSRGG